MLTFKKFDTVGSKQVIRDGFVVGTIHKDGKNNSYFKSCDNYLLSINELKLVIEEVEAPIGPQCNCGANRDPGSIGHHPDCPKKKIEG